MHVGPNCGCALSNKHQPRFQYFVADYIDFTLRESRSVYYHHCQTISTRFMKSCVKLFCKALWQCPKL